MLNVVLVYISTGLLRFFRIFSFAFGFVWHKRGIHTVCMCEIVHTIWAHKSCFHCYVFVYLQRIVLQQLFYKAWICDDEGNNKAWIRKTRETRNWSWNWNFSDVIGFVCGTTRAAACRLLLSVSYVSVHWIIW